MLHKEYRPRRESPHYKRVHLHGPLSEDIPLITLTSIVKNSNIKTAEITDPPPDIPRAHLTCHKKKKNKSPLETRAELQLQQGIRFKLDLLQGRTTKYFLRAANIP